MGVFNSKADVHKLTEQELRSYWQDYQLSTQGDKQNEIIGWDSLDFKLMNDEFSRRQIPRSLRTPVRVKEYHPDNARYVPLQPDEQIICSAVTHLARQAYGLNGKATFRMVLAALNDSKTVLETLFPGTWEQHPVIRYLILKLANISCPKRDTDYYQVENIVKDLAHLD